MSKEEFANSEKAIRHQWDSVGIPSNGELATSDDVVYVHAYTRGDGTEVRAHYRSKGGGRLGIGTVTGGTSGMGNSVAPHQPTIEEMEKERERMKRESLKIFLEPSSNSTGNSDINQAITDITDIFNVLGGFIPDGLLGNVGGFLSDYYENLSNILHKNGAPTGAAASLTSIAPLEGYVTNDDSNIFQNFLKTNLPQHNEFSPTIDNLNKYDKNLYFQTFPAHNDEALIDEWAIPNLVTGGMGLYNAGKTAFEFVPYAKDIWEGRNLLFHKPFKWMNKQEYDNYGALGKDYYQKYLQKNPVYIEDYGLVNFGSNNRGKDYPFKMEQYPFLRKNIEKSKWQFNSNTKNEIDRNYDHFYNNYNRKLFDYIIENIKTNQGDIIKNYKMIKEVPKK